MALLPPLANAVRMPGTDTDVFELNHMSRLVWASQCLCSFAVDMKGKKGSDLAYVISILLFTVLGLWLGCDRVLMPTIFHLYCPKFASVASVELNRRSGWVWASQCSYSLAVQMKCGKKTRFSLCYGSFIFCCFWRFSVWDKHVTKYWCFVIDGLQLH